MIETLALERMKVRLNEIGQMDSELDRIKELCDLFVESAGIHLPKDPFSREYRDAVVGFWTQISGRNQYDPKVTERTPSIDLTRSVASPSPWNYGDTDFVGNYLCAWGWILKILKLKAGQRVLEYGVGEGQIAVALARVGCRVSVVDVEPAYLEAVRLQAEALQLEIETKVGEFGAVPDSGGPFDVVLFFESFHHCLTIRTF